MTRIKAILFDQDGVLIDTERDGHRVAFNQAFQEFGYPVEWGIDEYHELLQVPGGKERMKHYLHTKGFGVQVRPEEEEEFILKLHKRKTTIFIELLESGKLPLRPGIHRCLREAMDEGLKIGVCTTASERTTRAIADQLLPDIHFDLILAGDVVARKKPDPEIYQLALQRLGLQPAECLVVEDSHNGLRAAKGAGLRVVVTTNPYTENEDLQEADIIVTCLGDPDSEKGKLIKGGQRLAFDGVLRIRQLIEYFSR